METKIEKQSKVRLFFFCIIIIMVAFGLLVKVGYIKFVHGEEYTQKAIQQRSHYDVSIPALRGTIKDKNGNTLAASKKVYNVIIDPVLIGQYEDKERQMSFEALGEILDIPQVEIEKRYKLYINKRYSIIKKQVSLDTKERIGEKQKEGIIKGVWFEENEIRSYKYDSLAAHVIGFNGHWGVEETYDSILEGVSGRKFILNNEQVEGATEYNAPQNGQNIVLTIDETMQHYTEQVLLKYSLQQEAKGSSAIIMDPSNGEILAMANYPTFNLNQTDQIIGYNGKMEDLNEEEKLQLLQNVWRNNAISDTYEPGSTYKPFVVAAALEEGVITTTETFECHGSKQVYDWNIKCWKTSGHGVQTVEQVLENSCNVGMMDIMEKLGKEKYYKYQQDFGFGAKTGIDIMGETSASSLVYNLKDLGPVEMATTSFGQGFNVTPIQLITGFSALINGGDLYKPHVVKQISDENGTTVGYVGKQEQRQVISKQTSDLLRKYMKSVVVDGTGSSGFLEGYSIGGKTGTAQKGNREDEKYVVSFISFAPVENPKVAVLVTIDEPKDESIGSKLAVLASKEIYESILPYLNIYPDLGKK